MMRHARGHASQFLGEPRADLARAETLDKVQPVEFAHQRGVIGGEPARQASLAADPKCRSTQGFGRRAGATAT